MKGFFSTLATAAGFSLWLGMAHGLTLSDHAINMGLNFHKQLLLVQGTMDHKKQQVIVTLAGPDMSVNLWQKKKFLGMWVNGVKKTFQNIPAFYYWASSDVDLINRMSDWEKYTFLIGDDAIGRNFYDQLQGNANSRKKYSDGLLQSLENKKIYFPDAERIFNSNNVFYLPIAIRPETPIGLYHLTAYYIDDGHVSRTERLSLVIEKKGLNSAISDFAEKNSLLYGFVAIIMAVGFGFLSAFIYSRIILPNQKNNKQSKKKKKK